MKGIKKTALLGLCLAVIIVVTALENLFLNLPFLPPGVKPGLSNIVTMYAALFINPVSAVTLNILKSCFVFITRGPTAGALSLGGGMLSVCAVILLYLMFRGRASYSLISVTGACFHNMGQYIAARLITGSPYLVYYLPALLVSGLVTGFATGAFLKYAMPFLQKALGGEG